jgi:hypothetical protein
MWVPGYKLFSETTVALLRITEKKLTPGIIQL